MMKEQHKSAVYLIGYRASSKTSAGRAVASALARLFADTDRLIEDSAGRDIASIFRDSGETAFRQLESEVLETLSARALAGEELVVATGGGIVLSEENCERMRKTGLVIWLRAPASVLRERIEGDPGTVRNRPALSGDSAVEEVEDVLGRRYPLYDAAADRIVDTAELDREEVCAAIVAAIMENPE